MTTIACVGSVRRDPTIDIRTGYRVEEALRVAGYALDDLDAAVFTGLVPPTAHHERFGPEKLIEHLEAELARLAASVPTYVVPGVHGIGDPVERSVESGYAPALRHEAVYEAATDATTYVPLGETVPLEGVELTQNPALVDEGTVLVTHRLFPELWERHGALAYLAGGQHCGRLAGDSLAPAFCVHDLGPGRFDRAGAVHVLDLDDGGVADHALCPLDDVETVSCERHADRGTQFTLPDAPCLFCADEDRYFAEWFRAEARRLRRDAASVGPSDVVGAVVERAGLSEGQRAALREFAPSRVRVDRLYDGTDRLVGRGGRPVDAPDPGEVYDRAAMTAGEVLDLGPADRTAYFAQHDVRGAEALERSAEAAEEVLPPAASDGERRLDRRAYSTGRIQGEWLFFPHRENTLPAWQRVLEFVADGTFYDARVATGWQRLAREADGHGVMVAVPNYFDREDVERVFRVLDGLGPVPGDTLLFKPVVYSQLGIHGRNVAQFDLPRSVRYDVDEFR